MGASLLATVGSKLPPTVRVGSKLPPIGFATLAHKKQWPLTEPLCEEEVADPGVDALTARLGHLRWPPDRSRTYLPRVTILPGLPRGEQAFRRCHFYVGTRAGRCK